MCLYSGIAPLEEAWQQELLNLMKLQFSPGLQRLRAWQVASLAFRVGPTASEHLDLVKGDSFLRWFTI